jgi:tetratricopeptide (TPR) repeat protein
VTALDREVEARAERALALADVVLRRRPQDQRALFARGAAHAALARYHLFRVHRTDAARASVRMRDALLLVDPAGPYGEDAQFGLGLYDYYADVLPKFVKLLRFVVGLPAGNKQRGLDQIQRAADKSTFHATEARVQLFEINAYWEEDHDAARAPMAELHDAFPGSPLWGLKLAEHLRDRLGQYEDAAEIARAGLAAARKPHPNYAAPIVAALFRLSLGESLLLDGRVDETRRALLPILQLPVGAEWTGRARLLLGRSLELEGDRTAAEAHYREAARTGGKEVRQRASAALDTRIPAAELRGLHLVWEARRLAEDGKATLAAARYADARQAWPASVEALLGVAEELVRAGQGGELRPRLEALAADRASTPPWLRPWAALLAARLNDLAGRRPEALRLYREVVRRPSGDTRLAAEARRGLVTPFTVPPSTRRPAQKRQP